MKTVWKIALACSFIPLFGCPRGGGQIREVAEEEIAEAVINQAISSYYSASMSISGEYATVNLSCTKGGTLTWAERQESGEICYEATSNGCSISGENYDPLSLSGTYTVCGFPATYTTDNAFQDLDGKTLYFDGEITVSGTNIQTRTCDYSLDVTTIDITTEGSTVTFSSGVTGTMCDRRDINMNVEFTVTGDVAASESDQAQ